MVQSKIVKRRCLKTILNLNLMMFSTNFRKNSKYYAKIYKKERKSPKYYNRRKKNDYKKIDLFGIPNANFVKSVVGITFYKFALVVSNYKEDVKKALVKERLTKKTGFSFAILIAFHRLKKATSFTDLGLVYDISPSTVFRIFRTVTIIFAISNRSVNLEKAEYFKTMTQKLLGIELLGSIDNTSYFVNQCHPGSGSFYRCDKRGYFISVLASF
jgi:hypothetical protein